MRRIYSKPFRSIAQLLMLTAVDPAAAASYHAVISGMQMGAATSKGGPQKWANAYQLWNSAYVDFPFNVSETGYFVFTLKAAVSPYAKEGALTELRVNQQPLPVDQSFSQSITATKPTEYRWAALVSKGSNRIQISFMNRDGNAKAPDSLFLYSLTIDSADPGAKRDQVILPVEPIGRRDPRLQPYSSFSIWNTPLGADSVWSEPTAPDTLALRSGAPYINAGQWSIPVYASSNANGAIRFTDHDGTYPIGDTALRPSSAASPAAPAWGGDHHMSVYSADGRDLYHFFDCSKTGAGYNCGQSQKDDACGEGVGGYGWGAGIIRKWEIQSGKIEHMLRFGLPAAKTKAGTTWISGLAWPANRSDYNGPRGLYRGDLLYGSTIGIPGDVDIRTLGLSPAGLVLAKALQDFGAMQRDTGGDKGLILYAEPAAEGLGELADMRADLAKIVPVLSVLKNQGPQSINGPGVRRRLRPEGLDPTICPALPRSRWLPGVFSDATARPR